MNSKRRNPPKYPFQEWSESMPFPKTCDLCTYGCQCESPVGLIPLAKGRVLIAGLGMGWLTRRVLEKTEVSHVVQVELEPEIIRVFGQPLIEMFPGKISFVSQNVWKYLEGVDISEFDTILFDIWPGYRDAPDDAKFKKLKRKHPNVWGWGDY